MIARLLALLALAAAPAAAETVAVTNARLVTMGPDGTIERGTIVLRDGRIAAVGANVAAPADARVIDAGGRIVTPGLIAANTGLGLIAVRSVEAANDRAADMTGISAAFDAGDGLNPDSLLIPVARLGGITRAITTPAYDDSPGREMLFAGQAAAVALGGPMLVRRGVAMVLEMGDAGAERAGGARAAELVALRANLAEVRDYARRRAAYDRGETRDYSLSRADLEALVPVVEGRMPLLVSASRASDIRAILTLAREERLRIVLEGAAEGWRVADELVRANVPVLLTPVDNIPISFETLGATLDNARRLQAAGVLVAFQGNGNHRERELRYNAGNAVAVGLPWEQGLAAITINPARIFGLADRVGSLETGKDADLVIWDGDPLDTLGRPTAIFIRGEPQPMTSRQTLLRDRYMPSGGNQP
ncbi:amidohydrolase family protein [Sphingosinicella sp. LHD-64]|uniref:amidohydrolase family protein n=1 Tax=Sphingosinicella sp. LHD-64 TaxID=3072139 RepID=UPI00280FCD01|nr:amidohydrolase family protein [Sphingosinicella sp. LHD-64]MDQ8754968.1 amidohydrolase family protein [Sphingosinicella sp. LHD-64]